LTKIDTTVSIAGLSLKTPVMTASGTCGYGLELTPYLDLSRLGALVVKGISLEPRPGNPPPRIVETSGGMLNAIGLENIGMKAFLTESLPRLGEHDTPVIVNILGETPEEYGTLVEEMSRHDGIDGFEVNVSCPNVRRGGIAFGSDPAMLESLVRFLREKTERPLIIKLSPNVTDIVDMARRAEAGGADGLTLINTIRGMSIDPETRKPHLATVVGGLSGPAIKPVALRMVWEVAQQVSIPVIGVGGVLSGEDAVEFLIAGASAVQVGTAHFRNPAACIEVTEGLEQYLESHGILRARDLIGSIRLEPTLMT
jgi:dihydroorotate dehydrogenase (NAD+) catalytic subunit